MKFPGTCNHCGEAIRWLLTTKGKNMPVNAEPDKERGNVIRQGGQAGVLNVRAAEAARHAGKELFLHHVVTCPYADRWRSESSRSDRKNTARR